MAKKAAVKEKATAAAPMAAAITGSGSPGAIPGLAALGFVDPFGAIKADDKKKSSKIPAVNIPEVDEEIENYIAAARVMVDAEAAKDSAKGKIAAIAEGKRVEVSRAGGELEESLRINGKITFTQPHGYGKIVVDPTDAKDIERIGKIQALFGARFGEFFTANTVLKIKNPTEFQKIWSEVQAVCAAKGLDVSTIFGREMTLTPTKTLTQARVLDDEVCRKFEEAVSNELITPYAAKLIAK